MQYVFQYVPNNAMRLSQHMYRLLIPFGCCFEM